ncbi:MAG: hypothetical protein WAR22_08335 [Desulfomonilia bacterium]|jgi:hypothetical protein
MCDIDREQIARDVLRDITLDDSRMLAERQRAIDALTLFHEESLPALQEIEKRVTIGVLKERARIYSDRIRQGARISMTL